MKSVWFAALLFTFSPFADAYVTPRNGNFFIGYTDVAYPGGFEPSIERVYNSKSAFKGIFGWGWGVYLATYLEPHSDGTVSIYEYGGGTQKYFFRQGLSNDREEAVGTIVQLQKEQGLFGNTRELEDFREKIANDTSERGTAVMSLSNKGLLARTQVPTGVKLTDVLGAIILRVPEGYERRYPSGTFEQFDDQGRLTRVCRTDGRWIRMTYVNNHIQTLVDDRGRTMTFRFNTRNLVETIETDDARQAKYRYNERDQLIYSSDTSGNEYRYEYDPRHNLTAIRYSDGTSTEMEYFPQEEHESIKSVKERDGISTTYAYVLNGPYPKGEVQYTVRATIVQPGANQRSESVFHIFEKTNGEGQGYLGELVIERGGLRTEARFNPRNFYAEWVRVGPVETSFKVDERERLVGITSNGKTTTRKYEGDSDRVTECSVSVAGASQPASWIRLKYDQNRLKEFENSSGEKFAIEWEKNDSIKKITMGAGDFLKIAWDEYGRMAGLELSKPGVNPSAAKLNYTVDGVLTKVREVEARTTLTHASQFLKLLMKAASAADLPKEYTTGCGLIGSCCLTNSKVVSGEFEPLSKTFDAALRGPDAPPSPETRWEAQAP